MAFEEATANPAETEGTAETGAPTDPGETGTALAGVAAAPASKIPSKSQGLQFVKGSDPVPPSDTLPPALDGEDICLGHEEPSPPQNLPQGGGGSVTAVSLCGSLPLSLPVPLWI